MLTFSAVDADVNRRARTDDVGTAERWRRRRFRRGAVRSDDVPVRSHVDAQLLHYPLLHVLQQVPLVVLPLVASVPLSAGNCKRSSDKQGGPKIWHIFVRLIT